MNAAMKHGAGFSQRCFWGYWALVETGMYYVNTELARSHSQFLSCRKRVGTSPRWTEDGPFRPGMQVSDEVVLYTQDQRRSDIRLVENFR